MTWVAGAVEGLEEGGWKFELQESWQVVHYCELSSHQYSLLAAAVRGDGRFDPGLHGVVGSARNIDPGPHDVAGPAQKIDRDLLVSAVPAALSIAAVAAEPDSLTSWQADSSESSSNCDRCSRTVPLCDPTSSPSQPGGPGSRRRFAGSSAHSVAISTSAAVVPTL